MIKVGCCGFPVKRETYYHTFQVAEVQQTFYQPPLLATGKRWREEAPPDFEFTMKAWQLITHEPSSPTYRRLRMKIPEEKIILGLTKGEETDKREGERHERNWREEDVMKEKSRGGKESKKAPQKSLKEKRKMKKEKKSR
jgi:uncharacterized protein YecE (DUF72 family)